MFLWLFVSLLSTLADAQKQIKIPHNGGGPGKLRMMHVSDVHYHGGVDPANDKCDDLFPPWTNFPCSAKNSTDLMRSIIKVEQPDMIIHTGDVIDGDGKSAVKGMNDVYGVSQEAGLPWAASLGNHDEESTLTRQEVMQYISGMDLTDSEMGPVPNSYGNFYVNVLGYEDQPVARLVFFDSRFDMVNVSINEKQIEWFRSLSSLPKVPTLAFYHMPLPEYQTAIDANVTISGGYHEHICADKPTTSVFPALKEGSVIAGFCGHDHTNDFCAEWQGIQLCYEGSPGYGAYGNANLPYFRRARITELVLDGDALGEVRSWKRVDAGGSVAGPIVDEETLWSAKSRPDFTHRRHIADDTCKELASRASKYQQLKEGLHDIVAV